MASLWRCSRFGSQILRLHSSSQAGPLSAKMPNPIRLLEVPFISAFSTKPDPPKTPAGTKPSKQPEANTYKVPEYFKYNPHSYYDIEQEMTKYRKEQPRPGQNY